MACSLLAAAAASGVATAQSEPRPVAQSVYNARIAPWPSPKPIQQPPPPVTPTPAYQPESLAPPPSVKTLYYQKDANSGVVPAAARPAIPPPPKAKPVTPPAPNVELPKDSGAPPKASSSNPELPTQEQLFRLEPEAKMIERTNKDIEEMNKRIPEKDKKKVLIEMPVQPPLSSDVYPGRFFVRATTYTEPNFVMFGRLYFDERNAERYGWEMGPLQPIASTGKFIGDVTNLPYKLFSFPCWKYDTSAGLCMPGDPVPYMNYPPGLSVTGALAQAGATVALYLIFP
jgi:hypothetical protein